jgi:hypothetical protein
MLESENSTPDNGAHLLALGIAGRGKHGRPMPLFKQCAKCHFVIINGVIHKVSMMGWRKRLLSLG